MRIRLLAALVLCVPFLQAQQKSLRMPIGDPARKDKEVKIVLDAITDTATGALREYTNPLGTAAPALTDTGAFAGCP